MCCKNNSQQSYNVICIFFIAKIYWTLTFFTSFSWWKMYSNNVWEGKVWLIDMWGEKKWSWLIFASHSFNLTLDKLGFWEYLARFSLDKFINGPSGLVNIEAWRNSETKCHKCFRLSSQNKTSLKIKRCTKRYCSYNVNIKYCIIKYYK